MILLKSGVTHDDSYQTKMIISINLVLYSEKIFAKNNTFKDLNLAMIQYKNFNFSLLHYKQRISIYFSIIYTFKRSNIIKLQSNEIILNKSVIYKLYGPRRRNKQKEKSKMKSNSENLRVEEIKVYCSQLHVLDYHTEQIKFFLTPRFKPFQDIFHHTSLYRYSWSCFRIFCLYQLTIENMCTCL